LARREYLATFHYLISKHIVAVKLVNHGTADAPDWQREFYNYEFEQQPHPGPPTQESGLLQKKRSAEPDMSVLREI